MPQVRAKCARCGARFEAFSDGTARELAPQPIAISAAAPPSGVLELGPDPAIGPQATRFARIDPAPMVVPIAPASDEGSFIAPQQGTVTLDTSHEARPASQVRRPSRPPAAPPSAVPPELLRSLEPALAPLAELVPTGSPALEVGLTMAWALLPRPSRWS